MRLPVRKTIERAGSVAQTEGPKKSRYQRLQMADSERTGQRYKRQKEREFRPESTSKTREDTFQINHVSKIQIAEVEFTYYRIQNQLALNRIGGRGCQGSGMRKRLELPLQLETQ